MKKNLYTMAAVLFLLLLNMPIISAVNDDSMANKFKNTDLYIREKLFNDAFISGQGNLVLEASQKFIEADQNEKDRFSKNASAVWGKISSQPGRVAFVEIREGEKRTSLWKSTGGDSAGMIEQWGPEVNLEIPKSFFFSLGINGQKTADDYAFNFLTVSFGSYFFRNFLDFAVNLSVLPDEKGNVALSSRIHFLIDPKWDINVGGQGSYAFGESFAFSGLLGASYFLSYKSSLDLNFNVSNSGIITIGTGLTRYFDDRPLLDTEPEPPQKQYMKNQIKKDIYPEKTAITYIPEATHTPLETFTPRPSPTKAPEPTSTDTPVLPARDKAEYAPEPTATVTATREEPKKPVIRDAERKKNEAAAGVFIEADLMSIARSFENGWIDVNCRLGFGDDGIFGMNFILDGMYYMSGEFTGIAAGLDLGFDFYPFGRSPSGFYIGPVIGARFNDYKSSSGQGDFISGTAGGEAGYRLTIGWLMLDAGLAYASNIYFTGTSGNFNVEVQSDYLIRAGAGVMFYGSDDGR